MSLITQHLALAENQRFAAYFDASSRIPMENSHNMP